MFQYLRANKGDVVGRLLSIKAETRGKDDKDKYRIGGIGAPYNEWTTLYDDIWGVDREQYAPGCFSGVFEEDREYDPVSCFNHNLNQILGRMSIGTLRLEDSETSLNYETDINPEDQQAMSVFAKVKRGEVAGASIWFRIDEIATTTRKLPDKRTEYNYTILKATLYEIGPVTHGQYEGATAETRKRHQELVRSLNPDPTPEEIRAANREFLESVVSGDEVRASNRAFLDSVTS